MRVRDLLKEWQRSTESETNDQEFLIQLTRREKAKIAALAEMYPGKIPTDIARDLIVAALSELEATMPYIPGTKVVSEDEQGDPIFEDIGPMPQFRALTQKYLEQSS